MIYVNVWLLVVRRYTANGIEEFNRLYTDYEKAVKDAEKYERELETYCHIYGEVWDWRADT